MVFPILIIGTTLIVSSPVLFVLSMMDRRGIYPMPRHKAHPLDCSVMQYTGHEVLRTLIRCHFSPAETTGGQYIYSGGADGRIHVCICDCSPDTVAHRISRRSGRWTVASCKF